MKAIATFVAIFCGLIVLTGYFLPGAVIQSIRQPILDMAITLAGIAGLVAILNLIFRIHWKKIRESTQNRLFSIVVVAAFLVTFGVGVLLGPSNPGFQKVVTSIQVPIESSLMAVLAVTMSISSLRLLQRQRNWMGFTFFVSVVLFLIFNSGILAFASDIPILQDILSAFHQVPTAGARGILIGIALGSLVTGIRVLIGSDQPYNG
jgi:hypothetical protein